MKLLRWLWVALALAVAPVDAATLLPNGEQQFFDNNGAPLSLGTVEFYVPATSTPKNTWQDATQSTLNTNPVNLDAAGRARIYGNGQYRQVVKDALGNTIWDRLTQDVYGLVNIEWCGTSAGSANVQTLTPTIPVTSYVAGLRCAFIAGFTNTAATTLNISGQGATNIFKTGSTGPTALTGGEIVAGNITEVFFDGTRFNIIVPTASATMTETVRLVTATTDTLLTGDRGKLVSISNSSSVAVSLPQANSTTFPSGWFVDIQNTNQGLVTLTVTTSTLDGQSTTSLPAGQGMRIVSDGTNYYSQSGRYLYGTLSPSALSTTTNDYAPAGLLSASTLRLNPTTSVNFTGLTGGAAERLVALINVGSATLTIKNESASSTAANRFALSADLALATNTAALFQYDGTSARWRALSAIASATAGGSGFTSISNQSFSANGTYTKASGLSYAIVFCTGAGGGGGGGNSQTYGGGGGGAGGTGIRSLAASAIGATESVSVGTAGTAAGSGSSGGAGGNTTFGSLCTGSGGSGGVLADSNTGAGGAGGGASSGDINLTGGAGAPGTATSVPTAAGGAGGSSFWGGAGRGGANTTGGNGTVGGGGGGGGGATAGGTGGAGLVWVLEFKS